mmetsp:Transcript_41091/g.62224  ORF Transcript_41091/g.62224 Transcript_41091/m.62224 type:complete len:553 (+) Transcript_41091:59-1717(+)
MNSFTKKRNSKQLLSSKKATKALLSSIAVKEEENNVPLPSTSDNINKEKLKSELREMEHFVGLDQVLEARVVVDNIQKILNSSSCNSSNRNYDSVISAEQRKVMNEVISESNDAKQLLFDMDNDDGWILASNKKNIIVHYRNEEGSPLQTVKTHTIFENSRSKEFVRLVAIMNEVQLMPNWFPKGIMKESDILAEPSKYSMVFRFTMSFGLLPISPRDSVSFGKGFHLPHRNAVLIMSKPMTESKYCDIPPPQKGYVRIENRMAIFIQLLPNDRVLLRMIQFTDMKLNRVPPSVLNYLSKGGMPYEIANTIQKNMANFEGSVWDERMKEKRQYYAEIEDRVKDQIVDINNNKKIKQNGEKAVTFAATSEVITKDTVTASLRGSISTTGSTLAAIGCVLYKFEFWWRGSYGSISLLKHTALLCILFLLGRAVPAILKKSTPKRMKEDLRAYNHIKINDTMVNASTAHKSSTSPSSKFSNANNSAHSTNKDFDNSRKKSGQRGGDEKQQRKLKKVSKAGRFVGRVLIVHKMKENVKKIVPKKKKTKQKPAQLKN